MITIRAQVSIGLGLLAALLGAGCTNTPQERVIYPGTSLNGQPVRMILDTGAPETGLFKAGAERIGLKYAEFDRPVRLTSTHASVGYTAPTELFAGAQRLVGPFPVLEWGDDRVTEDGLIGWSDIRNNILVFDGEKHTITAVDAVPAEAQTWLKLKVHPANVLQLEIQLANGSTGVLLVDTGWQGGVALSNAQWKIWRNNRPFARSDQLTITGPSIAETERTEAWADVLRIGPLTLTDLPVREAVEVELDLTQDFAGSLGLYAIKRMDFIVDGINGYAYLRPKNPPGPPYYIRRPSVADNQYVPQDWVVLGDARLVPGLLRRTVPWARP